MGAPNSASATCLGCGCLCDDLVVERSGDTIAAIDPACPLADAWFRRMARPSECRVDGNDVPLDAALDAAAALAFASPGRLLIYAAADLTCETHREMAGLADRLGATIDGLTSDTVAGGLLAAQRRGRATATLGELRHRADVVVFWGVDPTERYPRFLERFLEPRPSWSSGRKIVSVDVGRDRGPAASHERFSVDPDDEVDAVRVLHAAVNHSSAGDVPGSLEPFVELGRTLAANARYAAFVFDAEPGERPRDPALAEALIALVQTLNGPTRAALFALRGGGNRNGFESLLTWQTGYPFAVDFATGVPVYRAETTTTERLRRGRYDVALVVGSPSSVPSTVQAELNAIETIGIGPGASEAAWSPRIVIDAGAAGLHEGGLVLRMDDVPLEVRPVMPHPRSTTDVVRRLVSRASRFVEASR